MSLPYRQRQTTYQSPVRGESWREIPDNTYTTSTRSLPGHLSPLAPPMAYSSSTDSNLSISTSYSAASTYYNTIQSCHSPPNSYEYDATCEYEPRSSTQGRPKSHSTSSNQEYIFDGQTMAALPSSPRSSTAAERSTQRFICLYENCEGSFSRVADLSRHQKSIHFPTRMDCPKPRCNRKGFMGFTREDHLTEHLRQFHGEQLAKRTSSKSKRAEATC
ncbi:TPA_exp: putative C2H2 finger domain protein [Trichophyton benhamiae CBS 112371]|nr:TPA_exp: putative C2H2 finger domain protein [Trichophyton benhamiae CBS 112371]